MAVYNSAGTKCSSIERRNSSCHNSDPDRIRPHFIFTVPSCGESRIIFTAGSPEYIVAWILRVKLLVVAVQTVDVSLGLGAAASHLKAHSALVNPVVQGLEALDTNVL